MDERIVRQPSLFTTIGRWIGIAFGHALLAPLVCFALVLCAVAGLFVPNTTLNALKKTFGKQYLEDLRRTAVEAGEVMVVTRGATSRSPTARNPRHH